MTPLGAERLAPLRSEKSPVAAPRLAPGVELLGPYKDSGLENPPYLARRGGTVLQVSRLLHVVAAGMDGSRQLDEIAALAGAERSLVVFVAVAGVTTVREGPGLFATEWHSLLSQLHHLRAAIGMWDLPVGVLVTVQIALLALPAAGLALLLGSLAARVQDRRSRPLPGSATRTGALRSA